MRCSTTRAPGTLEAHTPNFCNDLIVDSDMNMFMEGVRDGDDKQLKGGIIAFKAEEAFRCLFN